MTDTTAWAHLPNAKHIDRILADLKKNPKKWDAENNAVWTAARDAAWDAANNVSTKDAVWYDIICSFPLICIFSRIR